MPYKKAVPAKSVAIIQNYSVSAECKILILV